MRGVLIIVLSLVFAVPSWSAPPAPTLLFTDLVSGPATGNTDTSRPGQVAGQDGAIVTVWGRFLGDAQGASTVTVNGEPARVYSWGRATAPADLYTRHRMQMVVFQVPHTVSAGAAVVRITVGSVSSNTLPFTVREGAIHFVRANGDDVTGDGTWAHPWRTLDNVAGTGALDRIGTGDIVYVGDGVMHRTQAGDRAAIDLGAPGTPTAPRAIVGYPGAVASIGDASIEKGYALWVSGYGPATGWVIAKLHLTAAADVAGMYHDFRLVGNRITAPNGDGPTGAVGGQGNHLYFLGNELTNIGNATTSKLYHPIYFQSAEACSGPRLPTESDREIAWNWLHDNLAYDGINVYRECGSSAYMENQRIHDNWVENQTGDGLRIGDYVTGENWIWNNVVWNAGLGPEPPGDYAMHVPVHVHAGWEGTTTLIHFYNNTLVGGGFTGGQAWSSSMVGFGVAHPFALDFRNNVIVSTVAGIAYLNAQLDPPPATVSHNLWFGAGAAPAWDTDGWSAAPGFTNASTGDFTPAEGSPLIGAAVPTTPTPSQPVPPADFYSVPRAGGDGPDLGAIERSSANSGGVGPPPVPLAFAVFPNPATLAMSVRLQNPDGRAELRVLDVRGRVVSRLRPTANTVTFSTADYPPGVYLVRYRGQAVRVVVSR